jgi:hypothetical protein
VAKPPDHVDASGAWSHGTIAPITGAFGSSGNSIADASGAFSQTILNNNFRVLEDKINAILAILQDNGTIS